MRRGYSNPEYRLVIPGRAFSFRSPKAAAYKELIRSIAMKTFSKPLSKANIEVRIDYFHIHRRRIDIDNAAKCILDALNGLAYHDDAQVRIQQANAYWLVEPVFIPGGMVDLIKPLAQYNEYIFIRIRET